MKMRKGFFIVEDEDDVENSLKHRRVILIALAILTIILGLFSILMMII